MAPTILTCAVTGTFGTRENNANLPVTPEEIANAALGAVKAGAAICHIHVRDPATGAPSMKVEYYREVVKRIRDSGVNMIINLTCGPGGRYVPSEDDPQKPAANSNLKMPHLRVEHAIELKPEICTLDLNTMWFGGGAVIKTPRNIKLMGERMYAAGVKPELEVFDTGHLVQVKELIHDGLLDDPVMIQLCMGIAYGAPDDPNTFMALVNNLPNDCVFSAFSIGRMQIPFVAMAALAGGNVRVGLEDNLYLGPGHKATNAELVARAKQLLESMNVRILGPQEVRDKLKLVKHT